MLQKLEHASAIFRQLCKDTAEATQIHGRSRVNEIYPWVKAGYVERSIFLAGMAKGRKISQPYATQVQLLPANACLYRFRQATRVLSYVNSQPETPHSQEASAILSNSRDSWLYQMSKFAEDAHECSQTADGSHPMASYLLALTCLLQGHEAMERKDATTGAALAEMALALVNGIPEPREGLHYLHAQYSRMNYEEFAGFDRMSKKHHQVRDRLKFLSNGAIELEREGKTYRPKAYYDIVPYLTIGTRAASVLLLVGTVARLLGIEPTDVRDMVNSVWAAAIEQLPGLTATDASLVALHGGGPAGPNLLAYASFALHGGGPA